MRNILIMLVVVLCAGPAFADTQTATQRNAPYSGFSDEFYYSGGRMTGNQSVYKNLPTTPPQTQPTPPQLPPGSTHNGFTRPPVVAYPQPYSFLSLCQSQVQDIINSQNQRLDEIYFSGSPLFGQATDGQGNRYNYDCRNGRAYIW